MSSDYDQDTIDGLLAKLRRLDRELGEARGLVDSWKRAAQQWIEAENQAARMLGEVTAERDHYRAEAIQRTHDRAVEVQARQAAGRRIALLEDAARSAIANCDLCGGSGIMPGENEDEACYCCNPLRAALADGEGKTR